jgi:hypothetical protein
MGWSASCQQATTIPFRTWSSNPLKGRTRFCHPYTVLTPEVGPQALPARVFGPLSKCVWPDSGKKHCCHAGTAIVPSVRDNDYQGEIKVMAKAIYNIVTIPTGRRIAQLLLLPLLPTNHKYKSPKRGDQGFSSSDAYWLNKNL